MIPNYHPDRPLSDYELPARAAKAFSDAGIVSAGQVATMSDAELARLPNVGRKTLGEVRCSIPYGATTETQDYYLRGRARNGSILENTIRRIVRQELRRWHGLGDLKEDS